MLVVASGGQGREQREGGMRKHLLGRVQIGFQRYQ